MSTHRTQRNIANGIELNPQMLRLVGHSVSVGYGHTKHECINRFDRRLKAKLERKQNKLPNKQATNPPSQPAQTEQLKNRKA